MAPALARELHPRSLLLAVGMGVLFYGLAGLLPFASDVDPYRARMAAGVTAGASADPKMLLDGTLLFLGEIPRRTDFEKGFPKMCYDDNGQEKKDPIEDDTATKILEVLSMKYQV